MLSVSPSTSSLYQLVIFLQFSDINPISMRRFFRHLRQQDSRYVLLTKHKRLWRFVISPWTVQRTGETSLRRGVLFLQVWHTGEVYANGYADVKEGVPKGHQRQFWETLQRASKDVSKRAEATIWRRKAHRPCSSLRQITCVPGPQRTLL